ALCELNYTVEQKDGSIDIEKAKEINEQFEISKQFWAHLVKSKQIQNPQEFIRPLPHISFVQGDKNVNFLKRRFEALKPVSMFKGIEYTEDHEKLKEWMPLIMEGRDPQEKVAASKIDEGTDVNCGEVTRKMAKNLNEHNNAELLYKHEVQDFNRHKDGKSEVKVKDLKTNKVEHHITDYLFIGAGGHAIPLLQKTDIPESKHLGGFPITGE